MIHTAACPTCGAPPIGVLEAMPDVPRYLCGAWSTPAGLRRCPTAMAELNASRRPPVDGLEDITHAEAGWLWAASLAVRRSVLATWTQEAVAGDLARLEGEAP